MLLISLKNIEELEETLETYKVCTSRWINSVSQLFEELEDGGSHLKNIHNQLYRCVEIVKVTCYYQTFRLFENVDITKIVKKGEALTDIAVQMLKEKFNISCSPDQFDYGFDAVETTNRNPLYDGLNCMKKTFNLSLRLNRDQYDSLDCKPIQENKIVYHI